MDTTMRKARKLLSPKVIFSLVLGVALIAALFTLADGRKVLADMAAFPRLSLLWYLLLMVGYEAVRGVQWHVLLTKLDIIVPIRVQAFAYLTSEVTKIVPIGNYFENYILERAEGTDIGYSSAATTLSVLIEVGVSLVGVVIIGVGGWTPWLRPLIVVGTLVTALLGWLLYRLYQTSGPPRWLAGNERLRKLLQELRNFREGTSDLLHPRVLAPAVALGTVYLLLAASALYLIASGLGLSQVTLWDAWTVYFFSLAFSLIFPMPVDFGVLEVSGVGAWLAVGIGRTAAVTTMLLSRVLTLGTELVIALAGMLYLHDELRLVLRPRGAGHAPDQTGHAARDTTSSAGGRASGT
jgi:hypothetical protein